MLASVLTAAVAVVSHSTTAPARVASVTRSANFPISGVVVPGQAIGGIALGMTQLQVKQRWGNNYSVCTTCGPNLTWLYEYPGGGEVDGAAVKFTTASSAAGASGTGTATPPPSASLTALKAAATKAAAQAAKAAAAAKAAIAKATAAQAEALKAAAAAKTAAAKATAAKAKSAADAKSLEAAAAKAATLAKAAAARAQAAKAAATKATVAAKTAAAAAKAAKLAAAKAAATAKTALNAGTSGTVVAVFTLGSPLGWGLKGVMMYDPVSNVYNLYGNPGTANCIGYSALTVKIGDSTTSFYSSSGVIYGFALTAASQSPCQ
jgi:hypothetical protein